MDRPVRSDTAIGADVHRVPPARYTHAIGEVSEDIAARLMVPGHKGTTVPPAMQAAYGDAIDDVYRRDLPLHIEGVDETAHGTPPFEQAQRDAADAYGAGRTLFLTNGGSQASQIICLIARFAARGHRPRILAQRNVHKSVVHAAALVDADVVWLEPERHALLDIDLGVTPETLESALRLHRPFDLVIVVSPNYYGAVSDVAALAAACRRHGARLAVDEAWGAHFAFHNRFPTPATRAGAHLVTSSTHKELGSLTQSAMLHVANDALLIDWAERAARAVKSTSTSSMLCASLDAARAYAQGDGAELLARAADVADAARRRIDALPRLSTLDDTLVDEYESVVAFDPLRVTVDVTATGLTGFDVRELLLADPGGRIEIELCSDELFVALFGIGDANGDASDRLVCALERIVAGRGRARPRSARPARPSPPLTTSLLRQAYFGDRRTVELERATGETCAEIVAPYPPGIAVVLPGEPLTPEVVAYLLAIRNGAAFSDCADASLKTVEVLVPLTPEES